MKTENMNIEPTPSSYGETKLTSIDRLTIRSRSKLAQQIILSKIKNSNGKQRRNIYVLELGCGYHGLNLVYLSNIFTDINFSGIDTNVSLKTKPNISLIQGNIVGWEPERKYDVVLSLAVIEHLISPVDHFNLISKCLNKDGVALVTTPTPLNHIVWGSLARLGLIDVTNIDEHKLYLTCGGIFSLAESNNLRVVKYKQFQFFLNQYATLIVVE